MAGSCCEGELFGIFYSKGKRYRVVLKAGTITWESEGLPETCIPLEQIIAVTPCSCSSSCKSKPARCQNCNFSQYQPLVDALLFPAQAMRLHYAVPRGKHSWKLESRLFYPAEDTVLKVWLFTIQNALSELNRPKKLLVFVNPYGGKKRGLKIYERKVIPLFRLAGIEAQAIVTQRSNHAKEVIEDISISKFDGIVCVGGDGSFSEILNAVLLKTQKEKGINVHDTYSIPVSPRIPFGIIPAGSSNAASFCTTGTDDPTSAALLIIMGESIGIDVCTVHRNNNFLRFAVTFLSYGFFGDVMFDSNKYRYLGPKRYEFCGFKRILKKKLYSGELQMQITTSESSNLNQDLCRIGCSTCSKAENKLQAQNNDLNSEFNEKSRWLSVHCDFMALSAAVMSCACRQAQHGISPYQHIGNGKCDVIVVSARSRLDYIRYMMRTAYNYKSPFDLDFVQVHRVKAFKFSPYATEEKTPETGCAGTQDNWQQMKTSVWNCDGEILEEPSIYARVHCQLIRVFGQGFEERPKKSSYLLCCCDTSNDG